MDELNESYLSSLEKSLKKILVNIEEGDLPDKIDRDYVMDIIQDNLRSAITQVKRSNPDPGKRHVYDEMITQCHEHLDKIFAFLDRKEEEAVLKELRKRQARREKLRKKQWRTKRPFKYYDLRVLSCKPGTDVPTPTYAYSYSESDGDDYVAAKDEAVKPDEDDQSEHDSESIRSEFDGDYDEDNTEDDGGEHNEYSSLSSSERRKLSIERKLERYRGKYGDYPPDDECLYVW